MTAFDDWLTDRVARRPAGARARAVDGAEDVQDFARVSILDAVALGPDDHLLEIGCGGGLLLRAALSGAATAAGLDHCQDVAGPARRRAPGARVLIGAAEHLPLPDARFTAIAMSVVFFFFLSRLPCWGNPTASSCPAAGSPSTRPRPSCAVRLRRPSPSPRADTSTATRR